MNMKRLTTGLLTTTLLAFVAGWLMAKPFRGAASNAVIISASATPELPRVVLNTDYTPPTGKVIPVIAGGDLQAAINRALPGDVITLKSGAVFKGNFTLPPKRGNGWVVIRSSASDTELPPPGTRVSPKHAALMPKILTPNTSPAIATAPGAHHYRLIGVEIGIQPGVKTNYGIVALGDGSDAQNSLAIVPTDLIVDRCYIHGNDKGDVSRGVALNSARTAVIDSHISECHAVGLDTQAICGWNGPGPFKIVNNYLEGAAENFMLGGADPKVPRLIPSDIEFRRNHLFKPLRWKADHADYAGVHWSIKNLFELKNAQRVLIEGNVFENNWADAQDGFALVWKSTNQDGAAPWCVTRDVTFVNNLIRHSGAGINLLGRDTNQPGDTTQRILIRNNLWEDIDGGKWGKTHGRFFQISDTPDVVVDHNTVMQTGTLITAYGPPNTGFVYTNNLSYHGEYGVKGDGAATGKGTIAQYFPGIMFARNVLVGGAIGDYPAGNLFPRTFAEVGVIDRSGEFRLTLLKPYLASATDGKDIGCDLSALTKAIAGVTGKEL